MRLPIVQMNLQSELIDLLQPMQIAVGEYRELPALDVYL